MNTIWGPIGVGLLIIIILLVLKVETKVIYIVTAVLAAVTLLGWISGWWDKLIWDHYTPSLSYDFSPFAHAHSKLRSVATRVAGDAQTPIYVIDGYLTSEECDNVIADSRDDLQPSTVTRSGYDSSMRTSETAFFTDKGSLPAIEKKVCDTLAIPLQYSERGQLQQYKPGTYFKEHQDYFHYPWDKDELRGGQRTWTMMIYLSDVEEGGETNFPTVGQKFTPKKGTAVVWASMKDGGVMDERTLHEGMPVKKGVKNIVTIWLRDTPQR